MRRLLAIALLCACDDPAALEVRIGIEEIDLDDIHVTIPGVVDCALPLNGEPEGLCPAEGGDGMWKEPNLLSFVLYGKPSTEFSLTIDGRRDFLNEPAIVTTTAATAALPPNPGERGLLELPLVDRTSERLRCNVNVADVEDDAFANLGSLAIVNGQYFAYTAVADQIARVRYERNDSGCNLIAEQLGERLEVGNVTCRVRARSLVARVQGERTFLAALCNQVGIPGQTTLIASVVGEDPIPVASASLTLASAAGRVTQPVLANLIPDSPTPQVVVVRSTTRANNELLIWSPFTQTTTAVRLPEVVVTTDPGEVLPGPIVMRGPPVEPILIAGYGGADGMVWFNPVGGFEFTPFPDLDPNASRRAPSLALMQPPTLVDVRDQEVRFTPFNFLPRMGPFFQTSFSSMVIEGSTRALDARTALAHIGEAGVPHAVFAREGTIEVHPFDGALPWSFKAWNGTIAGAQHVLLWNVDGRPGAEIIVYDTGVSELRGFDASGRKFDSWPIVPTHVGANLTAGLTRLGGRDDIDLDLVILAGENLEVITLGPNSAPPMSQDAPSPPWPVPNHDPGGTASWVVRAPAIIDTTP
jgi:hypothetical protein